MDKIKHLEMIQQIISRMAKNSFSLKGWTVTLIAALFALAVKDRDPKFFLIAYVPILVFWFLDSYYLSLERRYRNKYNTVRSIDDNQEVDFDLSPPYPSKEDKTTLIDSLLSQTELCFYLPFAIVILVIVILEIFM